MNSSIKRRGAWDKISRFAGGSTVLDLTANNDKTTYGKRLPACCYGANNKVEAMHSSIQDDDSSRYMPHTHFILEIRTDVNMGEYMSHSLCWKPGDLYRLKWDTFIITVSRIVEGQRKAVSKSILCILTVICISFCSFVCFSHKQSFACYTVWCNVWKYCASFGLWIAFGMFVI